MRPPEEALDEDVFFFAPVLRADALAVRDLPEDDEERDLLEDAFFAEDRPDDAFDPPVLLLDEVFDPPVLLLAVDFDPELRLEDAFDPLDFLAAAGFDPPVLLLDADFEPPVVFFAAELLDDLPDPDREPVELVFPLAAVLELDDLLPDDLPPLDVFFAVEERAPPAVFRPEDDLLPLDDRVLEDVLRLDPEEVLFDAALFPPPDLLEADFDLDEPPREAVLVDELFEAVFFVVAI